MTEFDMGIKSGLLSIVLASGLALTGGCIDDETEKQKEPPKPTGIIPTATTNDAFSIVYPLSGETVQSRYIHIKGVGLNPKGLVNFRVGVHTDKWWDENYKLETSPNWSWQQKVVLGGTGRYNNHRIRATAYYSDGRTEFSEVGGVVVNR
jgi:hypothetical protein